MRQKSFPWKIGGLAAVLVLVLGVGSGLAEPVPGGTLDLTKVNKYITPLVVPDMMPFQKMESYDYYEIEVVQFEQQILPKPLKPTTVWSYAAIGDETTRQYPAFTIEAAVNRPARVKWVNNLVDKKGNYLPHLLPIDQTLHWANPPMDCIDGPPRTDCRGQSQGRYMGPVPISVHLHGAHVGPESDGYPEAWWLPAAKNLDGFATKGRHFGQFDTSNTDPGTAVFQYPNTQRATTLWFHDHTLGMTRANVYAGPVGFYLLRGAEGDVDTAVEERLPAGDYEIPLVIQDKSFNKDGSLFYPGDRAFFEGLQPSQLDIPFIPDLTQDEKTSDVSPIWNPEFFGNTIVVNGNTWPYLNVEPRQYRLRFLNGSDSRFYILQMATDNTPGDMSIDDGDYTVVTGQFVQVGADGGFLPAPVTPDELLLGPAERADVIVDFADLQGTAVYLINLGPDEPFGGGTPGIDFDAADPGTTGQVMQFRVVLGLTGSDDSTPAANLQLPAPEPLGKASVTRKLSLNEDESETVFVREEVDFEGEVTAIVEALDGFPFGPTSARLGILDKKGNPVPKFWMDGITENPAVDATEVWEIYNFTADAHPIHVHLVQFEILNRQALKTDEEGMAVPPARLVGKARAPEVWETGRKDTVIVYPGEVARIKAYFDIAGLYVWHCHILSHEDNEMMRPICVGGKCDE